MIGVTKCLNCSPFGINFVDKFSSRFQKPINLLSDGGCKEINLDLREVLFFNSVEIQIVQI